MFDGNTHESSLDLSRFSATLTCWGYANGKGEFTQCKSEAIAKAEADLLNLKYKALGPYKAVCLTEVKTQM